MTRLPLRTLVLSSVLTTVFIGFTVFAVYVDRVEYANGINDLDAELTRAARTGPRPDGGGPGLDNAPPDAAPVETADEAEPVEAPVQIVLDANGGVIASGANMPFDQNTVEGFTGHEGTRNFDDPNYRVRVTSEPNGTFTVTGLSLDGLDEATSRLRRALAIGGAVIGALLAAVLWVVAGFLTRPVARLTTAASKIAIGQLDTPVGDPAGSRETAQLAVDLDKMLATLRTSLDRTELSAARAAAARDDMKRFLADMAHELRTPLTALKGYSDLYTAGMLEETSDVDRAMSRIGSESERLHLLVDKMLQLARESTATEASEIFDVAAVVGEVTDDLRAAYPNQQIELVGQADEDCSWLGVRSQIHQALLNLGANACHHNPATEPITIELAGAADAVTVKVVDHGPGIPASEHQRIFLPFYRAEAARSRSGSSGAGLGLALAKQIADQHDATLTITQTRGGGATFTLSLPRQVPVDKY